MEWISVKDRLPDGPNWVIGRNSHSGIWSVCRYNWDKWEFYDHPEGNFSSCGFNGDQVGGIDAEDLTHWMELPEAPKEN